jgi:hypothetical protein
MVVERRAAWAVIVQLEQHSKTIRHLPLTIYFPLVCRPFRAGAKMPFRCFSLLFSM